MEKKTEKTEERSKSALPAPEEILLVRQRSSFFNDDQNGVNWNNDSLVSSYKGLPYCSMDARTVISGRFSLGHLCCTWTYRIVSSNIHNMVVAVKLATINLETRL